MKNPVAFLRYAALIEGISFLLLLGVAMPLKYAWDLPAAVRVVGWIHGLLFMVVCAALLQTMWAAQWPWKRAALVLGAALVPFGPFLLDRRMAVYQREYQAGRTPAQL